MFNKISRKYVFCFVLFLSFFFIPQKTNAFIVKDPTNFIQNSFTAVSTTLSAGINGASLAKDIAKMAYDKIVNLGITAQRIAALLIVQKMTTLIIGNGGGGGTVSDWNKYLYVSPQQKAMTQMNSFFNTVSRGRLSSLNYEGVAGQRNYDAYLVSEAKKAIAGQPFVTNLQDIAAGPEQIFDGGNMKGLSKYMQCANNVTCFTLVSKDRYALELAKATEIAKNEQSNGFLPIKKNGKISQPASIVSNAFNEMDKLGTNMIMTADAKVAGSFAQIASGAAINIASRTLNYYTSSGAGQAEIRNKSDNFPFSLAYSTKDGVGLKAGGATMQTGIGSVK